MIKVGSNYRARRPCWKRLPEKRIKLMWHRFVTGVAPVGNRCHMRMKKPSMSVKEVVMPSGVVKWFDVKKGFGFIAGPEDGKDVFVHYSSIEGDGFKSLKDGELVEYELTDSEKGPQARHVRRIAPNPAAA